MALTACATPSRSALPPGLVDALAGQGVSGPFQYGAADLNGDGRDEIVARMTGPAFCGSGGCTGLVLTRDGEGWRTVMRATVTRLPFRRLDTRTNGWSDLGVRIGGGGLAPQEVIISFDGSAYPSNPAAPPRRAANGAAGRIVLDERSAVVSP